MARGNNAHSLHGRSDFRYPLGKHPLSVDLRPDFAAAGIAVSDTGLLNASTSHALVACAQLHDPACWPGGPSRLFMFHNERVLCADGAADDTKACLVHGVMALHTLGACDEARWPYDSKASGSGDIKERLKARPDDSSVSDARHRRRELFKLIAPTSVTVKVCRGRGATSLAPPALHPAAANFLGFCWTLRCCRRRWRQACQSRSASG